jgi:ketosteroid isomerase-like protein
MQEPYAEDAVFDVSAVFTDVAPIQGHEDMLRYWYDLQESWDGLRIDPVELFDLGDWRFVVEVRMWGRGKRSGAEVDQGYAFLYTLRPEDGKVVRAQLLPDLAAAISATESSEPEPA